MNLYMTSDMGGITIKDGKIAGCCINEENDLLVNLKQDWKENSKGLMICSSPDEYEVNEAYNRVFFDAFNVSGLSLDSFDICDSRNGVDIIKNINEYDMILLCGGHVPTQNYFMKKINLKDRIQGFEGIVIGISAGSMNCATTVYATPELEGEALDPDYERYIDGLGLTDINVLPHLQYLKTVMLDGLHMVEDIAFKDSKRKEIYGIVDGSYILVKDGKSLLYGEAYLIKDGKMEQICEKGKVVKLELRRQRQKNDN